MGWKETLEPVVTRLPSVRQPEGHVPFKKQLMWSGGMVLLYFFMTNILMLGIAATQRGTSPFGQFSSILAVSQGSLVQLGIGPIVTGSIVMQLLSGGGVLDFDRNDPREQSIYQGTQKLLVIVVSALTALPLAFSGFLPVQGPLVQIYGKTAVQFLVFFQAFIGGIFILYMDEIVSRWGVGSGVGLFIIAGISQRLIGGIFTQIIPGWYSLITNGFNSNSFVGIANTLLFGLGSVAAIITTIVIFALGVYFESTKVEIPIQSSRIQGGRGTFPIKLIYASVLPLIFVRAIQANIQFLGRILHIQLGNDMPAWLGVYGANGQPLAGFFYYLNPINSPRQWMWWLGTATGSPEQILIRVFIDFLFLVVGGAVFAVFWVETADMSGESVANQILNSNLQVPGFRQNTQVIERVVNRYIPAVTMLGGAIIGIFALFANLIGTIGGVSGTALVLSVSITYRLFQSITDEWAQEKLGDLYKVFS